MADFEKLNGRYITKGLNSKQFDKLFNLINKEQKSNRRKAKRTLTPGLLRNKNLDEILRLAGRTKGRTGAAFTLDDLKGFEKQRERIKALYDKKSAGITFHEMIQSSNPIDIKRANNKVDDGSGITSAAFTGIKHNMLLINVTASQASVHQHHRVRIRLEEWDQAVETLTDEKQTFKKIVGHLCAGRVSVDCDCGRWQYWYRYIGTAGNFAVTPPKEYAYPKVRNPRLFGVACKHILHSLNRLQAGSWQVIVARELEKEMKRVGYGDDTGKRKKFFTDKERRELARNRKTQINPEQARKAWLKYKKHQQALEKRLEANPAELAKLRDKLKRTKKKSSERNKRISQLEQEKKLLQQQLKDALALKQQTFIDAQVFTGKTPEQAQKLWLSFLNSQTKGGKK